MATQIVRDKFRIWHKTGRREEICVISAHAAPNGKTFTVNSNIRIFFYVEAGKAFEANTSEVLDFIWNPSKTIDASKKINPIEMLSSNCPDYELGKLQNYHAKDIGMFQLARKLADKFYPGGLEPEETIDAVKISVDSYNPNATSLVSIGKVDFVTIRYRPFGSACTFEEIVNELKLLNYKQIHCAFCR